ncbi:O-linked N-acetylglucosamine transferase family protein [Bordetella sp. 2513F-2]
MPRTVRSPRKPPVSAKVLTIMGLSQAQAEARTRQHPEDPLGWKSLGAHCLEAGRLAEARLALERVMELAPRDAEGLRVMADLLLKEGRIEDARRQLDMALGIEPGHLLGRIKLAEILHRLGCNEEALQCLEVAGRPPAAHLAAWLAWHGVILLAMQRYDEARRDFEALLDIQPKEYSAWNNLGNIHRDTGNLDEAERCYAKAASLTKVDPLPKSNRLTAMHYQPEATIEDILQACKDWGSMFAPAVRPERPIPADRSPSKVLRIGMFSDGFRQHPVGTMTVSALERLPGLGFEIYAYTTNNSVDAITRRIMALVSKWTPIYHLKDEQFAACIRDDQIDILIDLSGHNAGSRMRTMALEPAPVLVKWVGGLINTTGVEAIDYLITDKIESPAGSDHLYTEKLIRMPDDYICFVPPPKPPEVAPLPALKNGYITFGCFNNPTKINETLLARWAELLHAVPQSRLFLKGAAYSTPVLRQRVLDTLAAHGIDSGRVRIEGRSPHLELLARYNEVDIGLDPWPYSGGLTTCEALLMGVPVITLPGPTFAGRHSATHLVNAGMPELVADDWNQYRARAVELASDLQSLATIRAHLRDILLASPVCDSARFGRNLANALRAIWQRYCEGKAPAALALGADGEAWFEDEAQPLVLQHPQPSAEEAGFQWSFQGRIIAVSSGSRPFADAAVARMLERQALELVVFDAASQALQEPLARRQGVHYYAGTALGDGRPGTLYACLDASLSGPLRPLQAGESPIPHGRETQVLAQLPLDTVALDNIEGLPGIDWLMLDDMSDSAAILAHGRNALAQGLLIEARVSFQPTHERQPDLAELQDWANGHGYAFYRLHESKSGREAASGLALTPTATPGTSALFLPSRERLEALDPNRRMKLAFILHAVYGLEDAAYRIMAPLPGSERYLEDALLRKSAGRDIRIPLQNVRSQNDAGAVVRLTQEFGRWDAAALQVVANRCRQALLRDEANNTAHFILVHALLAQGALEDVQDSAVLAELSQRLAAAGWAHKGALYADWISDVRQLRNRPHARVSAILIANRFKPEIVANIEALREQQQDGIEIVFVNNGIPAADCAVLPPMVDVWIELNRNSGDCLARNLGAIHATAPILLFIDDDGLPEAGFVEAHLAVHASHDPVSLRGACRPRSAGSEIPEHYHLGDTVCSAPPLLEGNVSFPRKEFLAVGGWADYILFGHGGVDISHRLLRDGFGPERQLYTPAAVLQHDYLRGNAHAAEKFAKLRASWLLIETLGHTRPPVPAIRPQPAAAATLALTSAPLVIRDTPAMEPEGVELLRQRLAESRHYMEYGSGGSTIMAGTAGIRSIISVDSDQAFLQAVVEAFAERVGQGVTLRPLYADIGPMEAGGKPTDTSKSVQWPQYCTLPWDCVHASNLPNPDLVLIDGRFRRACFLISLLLAEPGCVILWDDYVQRPYYHDVEAFLKPHRLVGRMAEFIVPQRRYTAGIVMRLVQAATDPR